jgi:hypothetical protein
MKRSSATIFFLLFSFFAFASGGEYAVSNIPEALKKNADVVIRLDETIAELKSLDKLLIKNKFVATILNENGDRFAEAYEFYDKFQSIEKFEGSLYDVNGNKIKSLRKGDIIDVSATSSMSLADDNRAKRHNFYCKAYPYTVEYEIDVIRKESMFFPNWIPISQSSMAIEKSKFIMITPVDYILRFKAFNYQDDPKITTVDGKKEYTWDIKNYEAIKLEVASPPLFKITPSVFLAPTEFLIEDYKGNMTDWKEFGKFQYNLNSGLDILNDEDKMKVHSIVNGLANDQEKIFALYQYLQKSTRYVSIQLGIGGWRPFPASYVGMKGYGDCKALSNFMFSLLKEAGIKSYYTLIKAGDNENDLMTDFPSRQFNHAIICVPSGNDTIWLECTDQSKSPGYMGGFTGNRQALLITEEGGVIVSTPRYGLKENLQQRTINAKLDSEGLLTAEIKTNYLGMQQDNLHMLLNNLSKDKVKEYLDEELEFATYTVNNFDYNEKKGLIPEIEEMLNVSADHYATISGKRLFIIPDVMTRSHRKLKSEEERKYDIDLDFEYTDIDKIEIEIPAGYKPESIPQDAIIESKFGKYKCTVKLDQNRIIYTRSMQQFSGLFPKTDYIEMIKFYDAIYKADRNKLVLIKYSEEEKKPF